MPPPPSNSPAERGEGHASRVFHPLPAERAVLGALIKPGAERNEYYNNIAVSAAGLKPDFFSTAGHKAIFGAMEKVNDEFVGEWDSVILLQRLVKDRRVAKEGEKAGKGRITAEYIAELVAAEWPGGSLRSHCSEIIEAWRWRVLERAHNGARKIFMPSQEEWAGKEMTAVEAMESAQAMLMRAEDKIRGGKGADIHNAGELGFKMLEQVEHSHKEGDYRAFKGLFTSIWQFDEATAGLRPGELTVLGARPNVGKTALAVYMACRAMTNERILADEKGETAEIPAVYFVSAEMPADDITARALSLVSGVDGGFWRTPERVLTNNKKAMEGLYLGAATLKNYPFKIDGRREKLKGRFNINDIRAGARRVLRQHKQETGSDRLGLIVVDFLQVIGGDPKIFNRGFSNKVEEIGSVAEDLKELGAELGAAVLLLSQLSRRPDGRPTQKALLSDLRGSGEIEQVADFVLFMDDSDEAAGADGTRTINMDLQKSRYGKKDIQWKMKFKPSCCLFATDSYRVVGRDANGQPEIEIIVPEDMRHSGVWNLGIRHLRLPPPADDEEEKAGGSNEVEEF